MEYPHWLMVAGGVLVVVGFIGLAFHQNRTTLSPITSRTENEGEEEMTERKTGTFPVAVPISADGATAAPRQVGNRQAPAFARSIAFDRRLRLDADGPGEINTCVFWESWRYALRWVAARHLGKKFPNAWANITSARTSTPW